MFAAANIAKKADPVELCSLGRLFVVGGVLFQAQCLGGHIVFPRWVGCMQKGKKVWLSGHRTSRGKTRFFPDLFRAPGGVPAGAKCY